MTVKVTARDIERGQPGFVNTCPVALALRRQTKLVWHVTPEYAHNQAHGYKRKLPREAIDWIANYDSELPVRPFQFELAA